MIEQPTNLLMLCALALVMGARHGFDADHLAIIDGVARLNAGSRPKVARLAGLLFSLGHGMVILAVIVLAQMFAASEHWLPQWLEVSGTLISVAFLLPLAWWNLHAMAAPSPAAVRPTGLRARWLTRTRFITTPAGILATGMLFAISFDSVSLAVLFAVVGSQLGGGLGGPLAGLCFMAGMLLVDGLNGLWVAHLAQAADRRAVLASRVLAGAVGLVGLGACALALFGSVIPAVENWSEHYGLWFGVAVVAIVAGASLAGLLLSGRRRPAVGKESAPAPSVD